MHIRGTKKTEPVDLQRCQAKLREGDTDRWRRCEKGPRWVALELIPNTDDGLVGEMSLCGRGRKLMDKGGTLGIEYTPISQARRRRRLASVEPAERRVVTTPSKLWEELETRIAEWRGVLHRQAPTSRQIVKSCWQVRCG